MRAYDTIVVGSGVSGLTATLLLALNGQRVLLLEKGPRIGGSLCRFSREGASFDTGFHFTGGLSPGGLLRRMLSALDLADSVEPCFLSADCAHRFVFEAEDRTFDLPCGIRGWRRVLKERFPGEQAAVDRYFDRVTHVRDGTPGMRLEGIGEMPPRLEEETVSLKTVLEGLTGNALLKGVLCGLGMCHGVKPSEVSFATHSRVCYDLYESTGRLREGGQSLVTAFENAFRARPVTVACRTWIGECRCATDDRVDSVVLNTGEEVTADSIVFTLHPRQVLELLPGRRLSKAFGDRVRAFEPSPAFFTVFGILDPPGGVPADFGSTIVSLFPSADLESLMDPGRGARTALVMCADVSGARGVVTAFEPSHFEHVAPWKDSVTGCRPAAYQAYKAGRVEAVRRRLSLCDSRCDGGFRALDAATALTYRDYLHSPDGSAYGIKQKLGQYNVIGRLPVRNAFVAGQSALLPGVAGAMMSSFVVVRQVLGKDVFTRFMSTRSCN